MSSYTILKKASKKELLPVFQYSPWSFQGRKMWTLVDVVSNEVVKPELLKVPGIYGFCNREADVAYIGKSKSIYRRFNTHIYSFDPEGSTVANERLKIDWNLQQGRGFRFFLLELTRVKQLTERERFWIARLGLESLYNEAC